MSQPTSPDSGRVPHHPYDKRYYDTALGPEPYDRSSEHWLEFFRILAERIIQDIGPRAVLDVGCAKGFLVEALRDRGVEAFGIDISEYAIGEVRPDIRSWCRVASATEPLGGPYDLITCIEVLEHLDEAEGRRAIAHICASTSDVLFSSTPDDFEEPTHVNVRPLSWWVERFAEHGFALDSTYDAGFVARHAMRFRAGAAPAGTLDALLLQRSRLLDETATLRARCGRLDSDFRATRRATDAIRRELMDVRVTATGLAAQLARRDAAAEELTATIDAKDRLVAELTGAIDAKDRLIAGLNYHLLSMQRTVGWKLLDRVRRVRERLLPPGSRRRNLYWSVRRPLEVLLDEGPRAFVWKTRYKLHLRRRGRALLVKAPPEEMAVSPVEAQYQLWLARNRVTPAGEATMRAAIKRFRATPVISVLVPVYNTEDVWLQRAIESVLAQIYGHWQLCLVNDASTRPGVAVILDEHARRDARVCVRHLTVNQGIAGASAAALALAHGDFVALLDHDDELAPEALFEVARALEETPDLDVLYTDEDKLEPDGRRVEPFFKPDWSPDLLLSMNYITHLAVFRRSLLEAVDGFRAGFDGSQDYDLLLRATERTDRIAHIPKVLYHWRKIPGSAAASAAAKPYAYDAARRALEEATRRRGRPASVTAGLPGTYAVRYPVLGEPRVSIIIPTRDRWPLLEQCLRSIEERTRYPHYEIVILDNDSVETETREGLEVAARKWSVLPVPGAFNFSAINNRGAAAATGEYLVFLNNDTQVIDPGWLSALLEHAQRPEVGAVGARLHYPDGRIQHAGLVLGVGGVAEHAFKGYPGEMLTPFAMADVVRNCSAVTAACMMVRRHVFDEVGGFDERLGVALNDVDLCLRLRQRGYLIVYTPHALLYHHESGTRGRLHPPADEERIWQVWGDTIRRGDPYYNPNLTLSRPDWSLRD